MTTVGRVAQSAGYVPAPGGPRFRMVTEPAAGAACGTVLWGHAFGEEMNKSRRMSGRMARLLATLGWRVVQTDLHGCGDSAGEFCEATWEAWSDDLRSELARAPAGQPVWFWGVRAGALLASALMQTRPDLHLLLWQPVVSGAQHLQQFLRLHAGARIVGNFQGTAESAPAELLKSGQIVELGGYELSPALAEGLARASFDVPAEFRGRVVWLEVSADPDAAASPMAQRSVDRLRAAGVSVDIEVVPGPAFWQTQEIEDCDALLERSAALVGADVPA